MRIVEDRRASSLSWAVLAVAGLAAASPAAAEGPRHRPPGRAAHSSAVAGRVLTVHRHAPRFAGAGRGVALDHSYENGVSVPSPLRRWNDPNLDSFGGWRLGGDNFYGDGRGEAITRGNATLGAIAGYGPARGGYGGPHFDSVGGFHDGPGPDAREDADYASGSISTPDYGGIVPRYPSFKARVAALNTGVVPRDSARLERASFRAPAAPTIAVDTPPAEGGGRYLRSDEVFPDLGIDAF